MADDEQSKESEDRAPSLLAMHDTTDCQMSDDKQPTETKADDDTIFVTDKHISDLYGEKGVYTGAFSKSSSMPNGKGRVQYEKEDQWYEGDFIHGRWTGTGRVSNGDGDVYEGGLSNDQKHGTGVMRFDDGRVFEGEYIRGQMTEGKMVYPDGSVYIGAWDDGMRNGHGKCIFIDGSEYEGEFVAGEMHGQGKMTWDDGGWYAGEWCEGQMQGKGKEVRWDGTVRHDGEWSNGLPVRSNSKKQIRTKKQPKDDEDSSTGDEIFVYSGGKNITDKKKIEIGSELAKIDNEAFHDWKSDNIDLEFVDFSKAEKLESIGAHAFDSCKYLEVLVNFPPQNLKTIGIKSFHFCEGIKYLDLSNASKLEIIGTEAFSSCSALESFVAPKSLKIIGKKSFMGCFKMTSVDLSQAILLESILEQAFLGCQGLKHIDLSKNSKLENIEHGSFFRCNSLETACIPSSVTFFGEGVFSSSEKSGEPMECPKPLESLQSIDIQGENFPLAIRLCALYPNETQKISTERLVHSYSTRPINPPELLTTDDIEKEKLHQVMTAYVMAIINKDFDLVDVFTNPKQAHGWVLFLANIIEENSKDMEKLADYINNAELEAIKTLAFAKDIEGRLALKFAKSFVRLIFEERLFLFGRYELAKGPPIHRSATCIVIRARDSKMKEYFEEEFHKYDIDQASYLDIKKFQSALQDMKVISDKLDNDEQNSKVGNDSSKSLVEEKISQAAKQYFKGVDIDGSGKITKDEFAKFCLSEFGDSVVLKFMRNKDQYQRELNGREHLKDNNHIVQVLRSHDITADDKKRKELPSFLGSYFSESRTEKPHQNQQSASYDNVALSDSLVKPVDVSNVTPVDGSEKIESIEPQKANTVIEKPEDYCFVLVMPFGDRNLAVIYQSERPDMITTRKLMMTVALALLYLHKNNLIHGDLKMLNVVRIMGRLCLIDFDACAVIGEEFIGAKFSSGVLPPEMIHCSSAEEADKISNYLEYESTSEQEKRKTRFSSDRKRGYTVRSFLTEEGDDASDPRPTVKQGLPYDLVKADPSFDVWSFGVLLYDFCTGESLFKVNRDGDITDGEKTGDLLKRLYEWDKPDLNIEDRDAKDLLMRILQRDPAKRPTMREVLDHDFFHPERNIGLSEIHRTIKAEAAKTRETFEVELSKVRESINAIQKQQAATNNMLKHIIKGGPVPRYIVIAPSEPPTGMARLIDFANLSKWINKQVRVNFVCPISLQAVVDDQGETFGYDLDLPKEWVTKYGPALLVSLKIIQTGFAIGRGCGLPLPSLGDVAEKLVEGSEFLSTMQGFVISELGGEDDDSLGETILSYCEEEIDNASSEDFSLPERHREVLSKSYNEVRQIGRICQDENFENCGLVQVTSKDGTTEFVHPDFTSVYEEFGSTCFDMTLEELNQERAKLAAAERKNPSDPSQLKRQLEMKNKEIEAARAEAKAAAQVAGAKTQAASEGIIHQGWLQKKNVLGFWHFRYFVLYANGLVTYFPNKESFLQQQTIGKSFLSVNWTRQGEVMVLQRSNGTTFMTLRLSKLSRYPSQEDWIRFGNQWSQGIIVTKPSTLKEDPKLLVEDSPSYTNANRTDNIAAKEKSENPTSSTSFNKSKNCERDWRSESVHQRFI